MNIESGGSSRSQDFDLNLAPIIDCFTVLITFMLVSASFLAVGILDAGAGAAAEAPQSQTPPPIVVQLELQNAFVMELKISGKVSKTVHLAAKADSWDFETLQQELAHLKQQWPTTDSMLLSATDNVEYQHVVQTMEKIKGTIPNILLGGF